MAATALHLALPLAAVSLRLDAFSMWTALWLFLAVGAIVVWLGMRSMAGLGPLRQWTAITLRLAVLALLILILGDVQWVRQNTDVEVMIVRDISRSTELVSDFPGKYLQSALDDYVLAATGKYAGDNHRSGDRVGQISFNERPFIDAVPAERLMLEARAVRGPGTGTDAAAALQLALASLNNNAMHRLLLIWDGNATAGEINAAVSTAASEHVPIDVMPLHYHVEHEVMLDKFIAPNRRELGQPFTIETHLFSTNAAEVQGDLSITNNGRLIVLADGKTTQRVTIPPGRSVQRVEIPPQPPGVHLFHATLQNVKNVQSDEPAATDLDNKSADSFTFVGDKGQILLVDNADPTQQTDAAHYLREALQAQQINLTSIRPEEFPGNPVELQGYQAVILANVPRGAGGLNDQQEQMLANYVHFTGGGLVMIGGPQSFGAGGWEGSHLEKELPVSMEIPAQRQIPKGALVMVMDPCEVPSGNTLGEECAMKATEALSSRDDVGLISYSYTDRGPKWDAPLLPRGDGSRVIAAIRNWSLGDMPSLDTAVNLALDGDGTTSGMLANDARAKHIIVITDDDKEVASDSTLQRCVDAKISISTVTVHPHQQGNIVPGIRNMADKTGGKSYGPIDDNMTQVPQIFIKEATQIKRSIVQEDANGFPVRLAPSDSELVKGIAPGDLPKLYGFDLTARRENPLIEQPITIGPKHDPLLAQWQAGLGKTAAYTGDAFNRWDAEWINSGLYTKFWPQVVRGVSRSAVSNDFDVEMSTDGDKGHIVVSALNDNDAFNSSLTISGTMASGDELTSRPIRLAPTGPGTYEADFDASSPGNYLCYLTYGGAGGKSGTLLAGTVVNTSPELRDLQSGDAVLQQIAERTGGRLLEPFNPKTADLFSRDGLAISSSPKPIWDLLIPWLLALLLLDVAVRRIAWDAASIRRAILTAGGAVRRFTTPYQRVENAQALQTLKRVRGETAQQKFGGAPPAAPTPPTAAAPDASAKFDAGAGVAGDLNQIVGGAASANPDVSKSAGPKTPQPGDHTGGLLEAKRRAQRKIREQENPDDKNSGGSA